MKPKKISFSDAQRHYDNLTPESVNSFPKRRVCRIEPEDDYEDESYYKSKAFSRVMDAYENRMDWKYER
jgi:hypothetical protein